MNEKDYKGVSGCYLIHASSKLHHAQHYIGWAKCIYSRMKQHRRGKGAKLTAAFNNAGITYELVYVWPDTNKVFERRLHNQKNSTKKLCPICIEQSKIKALQFFNEPLSTLAMLRLTIDDVIAVKPM